METKQPSLHQTQCGSIEALIAGETDPVVLADMAQGRMRPKIPELVEAMDGMFRSHHGVVCTQILAHIDYLDTSIAALSEEVIARMGPFEPAIALLETIPGVSRITAEVSSPKPEPT